MNDNRPSLRPLNKVIGEIVKLVLKQKPNNKTVLFAGVPPIATDPSRSTADRLVLVRGLALIPTLRILVHLDRALTATGAPTDPIPPLPAPIIAAQDAGEREAEGRGKATGFGFICVFVCLMSSSRNNGVMLARHSCKKGENHDS